MDKTIESIIIAITGAVISVVAAYFVASRNKRLDYSYDYRRFILEKRKGVYSQFEGLIEEVQAMLVTAVRDKEFTWDQIQSVRDLMRKFVGKHLWISQPLYADLGLALQGIESLTPLFDSGNQKEHYRNILVSIRQSKAQLELQFIEDIVNLDDVDAFKKEKAAYHMYQKGDALYDMFEQLSKQAGSKKE